MRTSAHKIRRLTTVSSGTEKMFDINQAGLLELKGHLEGLNMEIKDSIAAMKSHINVYALGTLRITGSLSNKAGKIALTID